jgi:3-methyladenine DNA glycosylase/8-oxoguanine DNA glycosylase
MSRPPGGRRTGEPTGRATGASATAHAEALVRLSAADPVLAGLVDLHGPPPPRRRVRADRRFGDLARAIVYQQLAGSAAAAIHGRFVAAFDGRPTPAAVLAAPDDVLAACGLSRAKAASVRDLAARVVDGEVDLDRIGRLSDEEVVAHLVLVRGIGRWTAQMFLMNDLGRPDVWPTGDYGVRAGYARAWGLDALPTERELLPLGDRFRPHRSLVAWYCWRAADTVTP